MSQSISHEERAASTASGTPCDVPLTTTVLSPDWGGRIEYTPPLDDMLYEAEAVPSQAAKTNCSWLIRAPRPNRAILVLLLDLKLGTSGMLPNSPCFLSSINSLILKNQWIR